MEDVLYFSKKTKNYYSMEDNHFCSKCDKKIEGLYINCENFNKNSKIKEKICKGCVKKYKKTGILEAHHLVIISENIPNDSIPVFDFKPSLRDSRSNSTVFSEALENKCKTRDNTKYANRDPKLFLEVEENKRITEQRIKELDSEPSNDFFKNLKKSKIIED